MDFADIISEIVSNEDRFIPALIAGGIVIGVFIRSVSGVITGLSRERTKREIAAYIAEGSMTPEHGERVLKAGQGRCG